MRQNILLKQILFLCIFFTHFKLEIVLLEAHFTYFFYLSINFKKWFLGIPNLIFA